MTEDSTARLARRLLGAPVDLGLLTLLTAAAEGDEPLLRAVLEAGLASDSLVLRGGSWQWEARPSTPSRLGAVVEARAHRLTASQLLAMHRLGRPTAAGNAAEHRSTGFLDPRRSEPDVVLTVRQNQVLTLLRDGLTAEAIGRRLEISTRTVTKHQEHLYRRLRTSDRLSAVLRAQELGLIPVQRTGTD